MRSLANNLLILALLLATPALAQDLPPDRVGRVSIVSGRLAFYRTGEPDWSEAKVNLPVIAGGWFATDPRSRAQLRIGPESINLAEDSQVNIVELHQKVTQLALTRGRVNLHLRRLERDETAEIDITRGGIWLLQPGIYDIESGGLDRPSRITVFEGSARFVVGGIDMTIRSGNALVLTGTDIISTTIERATTDEFVRWCRSHDYREERLVARRHVSRG